MTDLSLVGDDDFEHEAAVRGYSKDFGADNLRKRLADMTAQRDHLNACVLSLQDRLKSIPVKCPCGAVKTVEWGFDPMSDCVVCGLRDPRDVVESEECRLALALRDLEYTHSMCADHIDEEITATEAACAELAAEFVPATYGCSCPTDIAALIRTRAFK